MTPADSSNYGETQPLKINVIASSVQSVYIVGWSYGLVDSQPFSYSSP